MINNKVEGVRGVEDALRYIKTVGKEPSVLDKEDLNIVNIAKRWGR